MAAPGFAPPVPPDFYDSPALRYAVGRYDFGAVFREVRSYRGGMSQEELALLVGLSQHTVSTVEKDLRRLDKFAQVVRVITALGIPAAALHFARTPPFGVEEGTVGWMDRRDFHKTLAAAALGIGATLELDRLSALLPVIGQEPPPRRIGAEDVAAINQATNTFRASHYEHGGGLARTAAIAQLAYVLNLRESRCSDEVRSELLMATSALANTAGWMSCEAGRHEDAQRLWTIAMNTARSAEHPESTDRMVETLTETAHQSIHLGQPAEALGLTRYAAALTTMSPATQVGSGPYEYAQGISAVGRAMLGEAGPCRAALDQSGQIVADTDPTAARPTWSYHADAVGHSSWCGLALFQLSVTDPSYAPEAIEHLDTALNGYRPGRVTARARCLPALAGSYAQAGDLDTALTFGHQSVTLADSLSSTIPHSWLRTLDGVLKPHQHRGDVRELRHRIHEVTVPSTV
jgi:DNA-binding XRE family transcriptional regulator